MFGFVFWNTHLVISRYLVGIRANRTTVRLHGLRVMGLKFKFINMETQDLKKQWIEKALQGMAIKNDLAKHKKRTPEYKKLLKDYQDNCHDANLIQDKF